MTALHEPTEETRSKVIELCAKGVPLRQLAGVLGICRNTLKRHYGADIKAGEARATADVIGTLYGRATGGDTTACIFWLKCRAGWNDKPETQADDDELKLLRFMRAGGYVARDLIDVLREHHAKCAESARSPGATEVHLKAVQVGGGK